jgi:DNA-binding XRE family transcriptional regulator
MQRARDFLSLAEEDGKPEPVPKYQSPFEEALEHIRYIVRLRVGFDPARLRRIRDSVRMSRRELAGLLGVEQGTIWQWESGNVFPPDDRLSHIEAWIRMVEEEIERAGG